MYTPRYRPSHLLKGHRPFFRNCINPITLRWLYGEWGLMWITWFSLEKIGSIVPCPVVLYWLYCYASNRILDWVLVLIESYRENISTNSIPLFIPLSPDTRYLICISLTFCLWQLVNISFSVHTCFEAMMYSFCVAHGRVY